MMAVGLHPDESTITSYVQFTSQSLYVVDEKIKTTRYCVARSRTSSI